MAKTKRERIERAQRRAAEAGLIPELAPIKPQRRRGRPRKRESETPGEDIRSLETRARHAGITLPKDGVAREKVLRDLRAAWHGCLAGRMMARAADHDRERADLWDAIQYIRRTQAAYDRAIGAPNRHAQVLRLMAPPSELHADAASPPIDLRSDAERAEQARRAMKILQSWLRLAEAAAGPAMTLVVDDQPGCTPAVLMRTLRIVSDGIRGKGVDTTHLPMR